MTLEREADKLFSRFIRFRDERCQLLDVKCWGELECAHLIRRGYKAVRWEPLNAVALCRFHHDWMTAHPLEWNAWRVEWVGPATFAVLWGRALNGPRPDVRSIIEDLKERLAA